MSVSGISNTNWFNYQNQSVHNNVRQFRQEFQQLGQDLQSGNLSAAQQDFATLQQLGQKSNTASTAQSKNPIAQDFSQLAQDLQAGDITAAQQDYTKIQQDFQSQATHSSQQRHHHGHHGGGGNGSNQISQLFDQLGQALQAGNLTNAQQVYATLQQDLQQFGVGSGQQSNSNTVSVTA